jgi:dTDP-4-dehydrorhamnose 3,5-epimerase
VKVIDTELPSVRIVEPEVRSDERGTFCEIYRRERYAEAGIAGEFVQDNLTHSHRGVLRGLHFQEPRPQGKLVQALTGTVWTVVVDVRRGSPTFARWVGCELTGARQLWVPPGFAHGFCVLSETSDYLYKCTDNYVPAADRAIRWDDPTLGIRWPVAAPILSAKDAGAPLLADAVALPKYP